MFCCAAVPYTIKVETGSEKDCGTTANAYIVITGVGKGEKDKDTGKLPLILKDKEGFEPGCTDTFSIQAPPVNEIKQITVSLLFKFRKLKYCSKMLKFDDFRHCRTILFFGAVVLLQNETADLSNICKFCNNERVKMGTFVMAEGPNGR